MGGNGRVWDGFRMGMGQAWDKYGTGKGRDGELDNSLDLFELL